MIFLSKQESIKSIWRKNICQVKINIYPFEIWLKSLAIVKYICPIAATSFDWWDRPYNRRVI